MIDWDSVDTVLLDMDGTLLDLHFDNHFWTLALPAAYGRERGLRPAEARRFVFAEMRRVEGTLHWYCLDYWRDLLGVDLMAVKREYRHKIGYLPGAERFLAGLRADGRRALLVTNAHRDGLELKRSCVMLDPYLDGLYTSHDFGASKESAAFWDAFHRQEPFDPARTVFLDDSQRVLAAARHWGLPRVYGIARPDSRGPRVQEAAFPLLDRLDAVAPPQPLPATAGAPGSPPGR